MKIIVHTRHRLPFLPPSKLEVIAKLNRETNVEKIIRNMSKWTEQPSYGNNECSFSNRMATWISCQLLLSRTVGSCADLITTFSCWITCIDGFPFDGVFPFYMQTSTCESHFDRKISFFTQLLNTHTFSGGNKLQKQTSGCEWVSEWASERVDECKRAISLHKWFAEGKTSVSMRLPFERIWIIQNFKHFYTTNKTGNYWEMVIKVK